MLALSACRPPPAPSLALRRPCAPLIRAALQHKVPTVAHGLPLAATGLHGGYRRRRRLPPSARALPNPGAGAAVEVPLLGGVDEQRAQPKRGLAAVLSPLSDRRANGKLLALCVGKLAPSRRALLD